MKNKNLFIAIFSFSVSFGYSQLQQYNVAPIPYNPMPYDSGIQIVTNLDDIWSATIGIGFDFEFFGNPRQNLVVGSNCIISFDTSLSNDICSWQIPDTVQLPDTSMYKQSIMFPYQDVDLTLGGKIRHKVYGTPPNRKFVVSFKSVPYYESTTLGSNCNGIAPFTGQVVINEGSNAIEMYIENKSSCTDWNNGLSIMGIQDDLATDAYVVPGRNNTVWSATNEGWLFTPDSLTVQTANRISGRLFADINKDCVFNNNDYGLANRPIVFYNNGNNTDVYAYTDMLGYYSKLVDTGNYTFTATNIATPFFASNCPSSGSHTVSFTSYGDSSDNNLFADTAIVTCSAIVPDLMVTDLNQWSWSLISCDSGIVKLFAKNMGVLPDSVQLILTLNDSTQLLASNGSYTALGNNQYIFKSGLLFPGETFFDVVLVRFGCDTIGTPYCFHLDAQGSMPPCPGYSYTAVQCRLIAGPYDPNAMYVSSYQLPQAGSVKYLETESNDDFNYTVTFQNTGNAPAENVRLEIPLSDKVDEFTLIPVAASASYSWLVLQQKLIVDFTGINLPDSTSNEPGSHGYFNFKVMQQAGNMPGDFIAHQTAIYFDSNPAVLTDTALVKIIDNTVGVKEMDEWQVKCFPNPFNYTVTVEAEKGALVSVCDLSGRNIFSKQLADAINRFDFTHWAKGVYFVRVTHTGMSKVIKLVKE